MEAQPVAHPSDYILEAFASGKLDNAGGQAVRAHLEACPACRARANRSAERVRQRLGAGRHGAVTAAGAVSPGDTRCGNAVPEANGAAGVMPTTLFNLPPELAEHPQYEVLRELGRGGMGVVYLAKNKLMDRLEVLKVVNKTLLDRPGAVERFLREIRSAAKLNHPNVVAAHSALQIGELLAFAMEYVGGDDLAQVVKSRGPLPVANACHYVQQAAIGLQHAFEKGMVHRDIKPQNLILAREGKKHIVKVLDFGLAKATREKRLEATGLTRDGNTRLVDAALTGAGQMLGTPDYIAPEQTLDAAQADIRADIYSLGCTLYFLLSGRPPFSGKNLVEVLQAHHATEARSLNLVRADVPEALALVVRKMMAKEPGQRYQTPAEVVQALSAAVKLAAKGTPPKSSPDVPAPAAKGRSAEEKRLLRAETIMPSAEAAQVTMVGGEAASAAARDALSTSNRRPAAARQARGGRKPPPAATENKKGLDWILGAAAAGIMLVLGGVLIWGMYFKLPSKKTSNTPDEQQVQAKPKEPVIPPDKKKSPPLPEKGEPDDSPTPPAVTPEGDSVPPPAKPKPEDPTPPTPTKPKPDLVARIKEVAGIDLVPVPAGEFNMGSEKGDTDADNDEKPRHKVRISDSFWLGKYKVTVGQFKRFVGTTDYETEAEKAKDKWTWRKPGWGNNGFDQTDEHPVVCVSWNDAKAYCKWLAEKSGAKVRLPREAEWEYSCRARPTTKGWVTTKYCFGDNVANLGDYAWYDDNTKSYGTRPCGKKKPNAFGLYDMHGLAWEWCDDSKRTYLDETETDPVGAGASRVFRGGSFKYIPQGCRAAYRNDDAPSYRGGHLGFRVFVSR